MSRLTIIGKLRSVGIQNLEEKMNKIDRTLPSHCLHSSNLNSKFQVIKYQGKKNDSLDPH